MLDWLAPLLYALAALVLGILCLPIALSLQVERPGLSTAWKLRVQLAFFRGGFGLGLHMDPNGRSLIPVLLGCPLPFPSLALITRPEKEKKTQEKIIKENKAKDETSKGDLLGTIRLLLRPSLGLLASLRHIIGLKKISIQGSLGFADPAQTGSICGYLQSIKFIKNKTLQIKINPDFNRPGAYGQLNLIAHFHLGLLLLLLGRFGLQVGCRFLATRFFGRKLALI